MARIVEPYRCGGCKMLVTWRPCQICRAIEEGDGRRRFSDAPIDEAAQRERDTVLAIAARFPTPEETERRAAAVRETWIHEGREGHED
jgi:hypothetical protein